jgi:antitoxin HigA-1
MSIWWTIISKEGSMEMHNPAHPGEIIREDCIKALGLSVTTAAKGLGVSRQSLSELLNGRTGVSAEMAIRLEKVGWSTADTWLRMQAQYDLWQARQRETSIRVRPFPNLDSAQQ